MTPFVPKGAVAEWRVVYDAIKSLPPDTVVTNEQVEEALGRPLGKNRSPIYRAGQELQRVNHRTLATVRGVGYRIAQPEEHFGLVMERSDRARGQIKRGIAIADATDISKLPKDQAERLEALANLMTRGFEFMRILAVQVDAQTMQIESVKSEGKDTSDRVTALEESLRKRGILE
jgi:hypothetical protein